MHAHTQPPPPDIVDQAISVLLGSFQRGHDGLETDATEYTAEREISELEVSASAINHELLLRAALLKRHRNSSQRIYQLPQEIFTEILVIDVLSFGVKEEEHQRRVVRRAGRPRPKIAPPAARRAQLCNVSHRFLQAVMNTPRIWSDIRWRRDHYVRLLEMSAQAPLLIRCSEMDPVGIKAPGTLEEFLKAVWEHSGRWEALSLNMQGDEKWLPFLEFLAPRLHDLALVTFPPRFHGTLTRIPCIFKISGNPALRSLRLIGASIQWDGVDLSHLRSLSLDRVQDGVPSLEKLVETLRMASGLEELFLNRVNIVDQNTAQRPEPEPIHLNALITLWIDAMPAGLADYLIRIIRSPRLKMSHVQGLLLEHLENSSSDQNPYHHFFQIIAPTLVSQSTYTLALCNEISSNAVCLRPEVIWWPWPDAATAVRTANFGVVAEDPKRAVRTMVKFLISHCIYGRLTVIANGQYTGTTAFVPSQTTSYFPEDVLEELSGTVTKITASVLADASNILTFLGSIQQDKNTGKLGWACPRLEVLDFKTVQGLPMDQVQSFLDERYGDGNPLLIDGEVVQRPPMVTIERPHVHVHVAQQLEIAGPLAGIVSPPQILTPL